MDDQQSSYGSTLGYKIVARDYPSLKLCFPFSEGAGVAPVELLSNIAMDTKVTGAGGSDLSAKVACAWGAKPTETVLHYGPAASYSEYDFTGIINSGYLIAISMEYVLAGTGPINLEIKDYNNDRAAVVWGCSDSAYALPSVFLSSIRETTGNGFIYPGAHGYADNTFLAQAIVVDLASNTADIYSGAGGKVGAMTKQGNGISSWQVKYEAFDIRADEGNAYIHAIFNPSKRPSDADIVAALTWLETFCTGCSKSLPPLCAGWR